MWTSMFPLSSSFYFFFFFLYITLFHFHIYIVSFHNFIVVKCDRHPFLLFFFKKKNFANVIGTLPPTFLNIVNVPDHDFKMFNFFLIE